MDERPAATGDGNGQREPSPLTAGAFLGMGLSVAVTVGAGTFLGYWADTQWHTSPWLLLAGMFLGLVAAVTSVVTLIRRVL